MPFKDSRVFAGDLQANDPKQVALAFQQLAGFIDNPIADVKFTPATPTASPRTVTVQARDRLGDAWKGRWLVLLVFGDSEFGSSATQTIAATGGTLLAPLVADRVLLFETAADGSLAFTVTSAAGSRYISASVIGRLQSSGAVVIT